MQHTAENKDVTTNNDNHWKKQPDSFSSDDVINAYLLGKREGQTEYTQVLLSQFKTNIRLAQKTSEALFNAMEDKGFPVVDAYLKADGITNFNTLIIVGETDFLKDEFRECFTTARKIKDQSLNDNFHIAFTFMPFSSNLNGACIHSEGYFLRYDKAGPLSKPRKA